MIQAWWNVEVGEQHMLEIFSSPLGTVGMRQVEGPEGVRRMEIAKEVFET